MLFIKHKVVILFFYGEGLCKQSETCFIACRTSSCTRLVEKDIDYVQLLKFQHLHILSKIFDGLSQGCRNVGTLEQRSIMFRDEENTIFGYSIDHGSDASM